MYDAYERPQSLALDAIERRILRHLAAGLSPAEISALVGMPTDEVTTAIRCIISTLGARSRLEALIIAIRFGLIELPPD